MSSDGAKAFIARWSAASASERANSQIAPPLSPFGITVLHRPPPNNDFI
jgi:hypothetical protein